MALHSPSHYENKKKLQEKLKEVNLIMDALSHPIDERIKLPVAVLRSLDFFTTSSCEGHVTGETPYIEFSSKIAIDLEKNSEFKEITNLIYVDPVNKYYLKKYESLCIEPRHASKLEAERLFHFIKDFYESRKTDESVHLILESIGGGLGYRIFPEGSFFFDLQSTRKQKAWLKKAQKEFRDFAEFLYNKIEDYENH